MHFDYMKILRKSSLDIATYLPTFSAAASIFGCAALFLPLMIPRVASAVPVYTVIHQSDAFAFTGPSQTVGPQNTPIDFSFNDFTEFQNRNRGNVQARAGQGSLGITATASNNGLFAPQRQEVNAIFQFNTIFGSLGTDPVSVIMNLTLGGIVIPGNGGTYTVSVLAGLEGVPSARSGGSYSEVTGGGTQQDGMLSAFSDDGTDQAIATNPFLVPVNQPVQLFMMLSTSQVYSTVPGSIDFGSTMELSNLGDVFTIIGADGITVNSADAGIVNNRFGETVQAPEPGTLALFGIGVVGLVVIRQRRKAP